MYYTLSTQGALYRQTVKISATDASASIKSLIDAALVAAGVSAVSEWGRIKGLTISCEDKDCRIAFGTAATAALGHLLSAGQTWRITHKSMIEAAQVINKAAGNTANLMATLEY